MSHRSQEENHTGAHCREDKDKGTEEDTASSRGLLHI